MREREREWVCVREKMCVFREGKEKSKCNTTPFFHPAALTRLAASAAILAASSSSANSPAEMAAAAATTAAGSPPPTHTRPLAPAAISNAAAEPAVANAGGGVGPARARAYEGDTCRMMPGPSGPKPEACGGKGGERVGWLGVHAGKKDTHLSTFSPNSPCLPRPRSSVQRPRGAGRPRRAQRRRPLAPGLAGCAASRLRTLKRAWWPGTRPPRPRQRLRHHGR